AGTADPADTADPGDPGGATRVEVSRADLPYFTQLVRSFEDSAPAAASWRATAKLTVTAAELDLIAQVSPLVSATPRAVKRFINVYLLVRSVGRGRGWPLPERGQLALLLAIAHGLPELADHLLPRLATVEPDQRTLRTLLDDPPTRDPSEELATLKAWADTHPDWNDAPLSDADRWIELIFRFRFHREPATLPPGHPPLPQPPRGAPTSADDTARTGEP